MDRFDDVEVEILEAPQPAPRRRRRGLAFAASLMVAGGLALGATALANSGDPAAPVAPWKAAKFDGRDHDGCRKGEWRHYNRDRGSDIESLDLRY